jgi:hypothetical protein
MAARGQTVAHHAHAAHVVARRQTKMTHRPHVDPLQGLQLGKFRLSLRICRLCTCGFDQLITLWPSFGRTKNLLHSPSSRGVCLSS